MRVTLHVPMSLREFSGGRSRLALEVADGATLQAALDALRSECPGIAERVLTERGAIRQHVNVFVNGDNVRLGQGLQTAVGANGEIWILPSVSGG
jgi:molybdopterin converting factor small subunit